MPAASPAAALPQPLLEILTSLRCPSCHGALRAGSDQLGCSGCATTWPVRDEIAHLAVGGAAETWKCDAAAQSSEAYQRRYRMVEQAEDYNEAYRRERFKRWSTRRELQLLRRLVGSQGRSATLLDVPCGGGRLSAELEPFTDRLIEADIAEGQLIYGRRRRTPQRPTVWMTASAFHLPLGDQAIDGTICCRLSHHLPTADERGRLVEELLRVSRRFVVLTFFDHHSLKNAIRRARRPLNGKPPKMTMTRGQVAALARAHGARLAECPPLSRLASGHRYALLVKPEAPRGA